jgi:hypothetical protein
MANDMTDRSDLGVLGIPDLSGPLPPALQAMLTDLETATGDTRREALKSRIATLEHMAGLEVQRRIAEANLKQAKAVERQNKRLNLATWVLAASTTCLIVATIVAAFIAKS